ncbi:hypothetical protein NC651_013612 [Populus alba x Populus x berolinensis]|nr:hypothetical protein NC651_013612 [Populus alba x Populus x berolinensis]
MNIGTNRGTDTDSTNENLQDNTRSKMKEDLRNKDCRLVLQYDEPDTRVRFFFSKKLFLREADEEINRIKSDERKALSLVKEVTEYFHVDAMKEEVHPFQNFDDFTTPFPLKQQHGMSSFVYSSQASEGVQRRRRSKSGILL